MHSYILTICSTTDARQPGFPQSLTMYGARSLVFGTQSPWRKCGEAVNRQSEQYTSIFMVQVNARGLQRVILYLNSGCSSTFLKRTILYLPSQYEKECTIYTTTADTHSCDNACPCVLLRRYTLRSPLRMGCHDTYNCAGSFCQTCRVGML